MRILEPSTDIFTVGQMISLQANATDDDISNDQLIVEWISDKDGSLSVLAQ